MPQTLAVTPSGAPLGRPDSHCQLLSTSETRKQIFVISKRQLCDTSTNLHLPEPGWHSQHRHSHLCSFLAHLCHNGAVVTLPFANQHVSDMGCKQSISCTAGHCMSVISSSWNIPSPHPSSSETAKKGIVRKEVLRKRQEGNYKLIPSAEKRKKECAREKGISTLKGQL